MIKRSIWMWMIVIPVLLLSACGQSQATGQGHVTSAQNGSLPPGVMSAAQACRVIVGKASPGFFDRPEQVHLVLTSYAKGEPASRTGTSVPGCLPKTLVWVVEVHAKAVNWDHSSPPGYKPGPPDTDFSVVMNAKTGYVSDQGECDCWPLPLSTVGTVVSLPPKC